MEFQTIKLDHGSGGKLSHDLTTNVILPYFQNDILSPLDDGAMILMESRRLAFSTDTFVVDPIFFPGGSIGDLAVNGTVNDLAMCGAVPQYISIGLIIEEGFSIADLKRILGDIKAAADRSGVIVATGDTKVVPHKVADKIFINTSGIGFIPDNVTVSGRQAQAGDKILISGTMADHGMAILSRREGLDFKTNLKSDSAALNHLVRDMLLVCPNIHVLRDPTRGGVGTVLNEIAESSRVGIKIYESRLPVKKEVAAICELLGYDPLYVANEGKLLAFVPEDAADRVLEKMKENAFGKDACCIGEVVTDRPGRVVMQTRIGGMRIVDMLAGEQLPRIC